MATTTSPSISQRFGRLPDIQKAREQEYEKQAESAERLFYSLRETRREAERLAKDEIERTRRVQVEEFRRHPEMQKWQKSTREAEQQVRVWSVDAERRSQQLRETIAMLEQKLGKKQAELDRIQAEMGGLRGEEERLRGELGRLELELMGARDQVSRLRADEDSNGTRLQPVLLEHNRLQKNIEELKRRRAEVGRQYDQLSTREAALNATRDALLREIEGLRSNLAAWETRMAEIMAGFRRAEELQAEAQWMIQQHQKNMDKINADRDTFAGQLDVARRQRDEAQSLLNEVCQQATQCQRDLETADRQAGPLRQRLEDVLRQIRALEEEAQGVRGKLGDCDTHQYNLRRQLQDLDGTRQGAESQVASYSEAFNRAEQFLGDCLAFMAQEKKTADQLEAKASEAHAEVVKAHDLQKAAEQGHRLASEQLGLRGSTLENVEKELREVRGELQAVNVPQTDDEIRTQQGEYDRVVAMYRGLLEEQRKIRGERESAEHRIGLIESQLRSLRGKLDQGAFAIAQASFDRLMGEIGSIKADIDKARYELGGVGGANPFEYNLRALHSQASEMESRIYSMWTASNAPAALVDQLKREAEAVMRAEAALTLEKQQEKVVGDARDMTRFRISREPQFDLDDEAKNTLLLEHSGVSGPREIASRVLQMCEQHHIKA